MRTRAYFILTLLLATLAAAGPPWLALREARRQAFDIESGQALNYAHDILHRSDQTIGQALAAIQGVTRAGLASCSPQLLALMRQIDVTSSYVQAIGHVRDGSMDCSSIGGPPAPLGPVTFRTARGITVYGTVSLFPGSPSPLVGLALDGVVVLVHRDLPIDIWTAVPGVSLAVVQLEHPEALIESGHVDPRWTARLGYGNAATFIDGDWLVAVARSPHYPSTAAVAAVPAAHLRQRIADTARQLMPASLFGGLAAAAAFVLLARQQLSMHSSMRAALRRGDFFLLYQPVVDLRSGRWTGVEALLRWDRGAGEAVGPDLFIPIAERSGLVTKLTERVLELVESDAGQFLATHPQFHIGINLSAADLRSPALIGCIDRLLQRTQAWPSNLMVEITERGFLDLESARAVIAALRARGIEVAIDDFGTGYSSLSYLETLDLDFMKIDRSFIEAIGTGAPTSQVVGHIIAMARTMRLRMIAEGIESPAQLAYLEAQGVQYGQGWLLGRPMPFADIARTVAQQDGAEGSAAPRAG